MRMKFACVRSVVGCFIVGIRKCRPANEIHDTLVHRYVVVDIVGTGGGITVSAMLAFIPRLLGVLHVEMLVHGNATAEEVRPSLPYPLISPVATQRHVFWCAFTIGKIRDNPGTCTAKLERVTPEGSRELRFFFPMHCFTLQIRTQCPICFSHISGAIAGLHT